MISTDHKFEIQGTITVGSGDPLFIQVCHLCGEKRYTLGRNVIPTECKLTIEEKVND